MMNLKRAQSYVQRGTIVYFFFELVFEFLSMNNFWKSFTHWYWVSFAIILVTFFAKLQRCYGDLLKIFYSIGWTRAENVKNNDRCRYLKRSNDQRIESLWRQNHDKALQIILYSKGQKLVLVLDGVVKMIYKLLSILWTRIYFS